MTPTYESTCRGLTREELQEQHGRAEALHTAIDAVMDALRLREETEKGNQMTPTKSTPIPKLIVKRPLIEPGAEVFRDEEGRISPFHHDAYHMGMKFSRNVMIMMENHDEQPADYMLLVNRTTGEVVEIQFPENWR